MNKTPGKAKPFLKWAGGKGQLLEKFKKYYPGELKNGKISKYCEPFVGSGAVFFHVAQNYKISEFLLSDINQELILAYLTIKEHVDSLIEILQSIENEYHNLNNDEQREYYYDTRKFFNEKLLTLDINKFSSDWVERTAQMLFLNRTCFNGLFRVNSKGEYNVPFGRYNNPKICNESNLLLASKLFQKSKIVKEDFTFYKDNIDSTTFVYFDPPYRPISKTSSFTSYSKFEFDDDEQIRLAQYFKELDSNGAKLMLSNSDPRNGNSEDYFFDELYEEFNVFRVKANRMINVRSDRRGKLNEIIITNYPIIIIKNSNLENYIPIR